RRGVIVGIVIEGLPRSQILWIFRPRGCGGNARLQRITGQRVKFVVLLARADKLWGMRMIINGFDLLDFSKKLRVRSLRASHAARGEEGEGNDCVRQNLHESPVD